MIFINQLASRRVNNFINSGHGGRILDLSEAHFCPPWDPPRDHLANRRRSKNSIKHSVFE